MARAGYAGPVLAPRPDLELPEPRSAADAKAIADIREYGWHAVLVADEFHPEHAEANAALPPHAIYDAAFSYTVGVWGSFGHPELVLVGRWEHRHSYLSALVTMVQQGRRFDVGDTTEELLEGYTVRFEAVSVADRLELLTWAHWANMRKPFEALQVVLPDLEGRWPEDPDYSSFPQPRLSTGA